MEPGGEQLVQILSFQLLKPFGKVVLQLDKFIGGNRRCSCFLQLSFGIKPQISHLAAIHFQMTLQKKQTNKQRNTQFSKYRPCTRSIRITWELVKMQIIGSQHRPVELKTLGVSPSYLVYLDLCEGLMHTEVWEPLKWKLQMRKQTLVLHGRVFMLQWVNIESLGV